MIQSQYWNEVRVHHDGDSYFSDIIDCIRNAQKEILIEVYIFKSDMLGKKILEELSLAQKRGVEVCLMVDGIGSYWWIQNIRNFCKENQIQFKVYHPTPMNLLKNTRAFNFYFLNRLLKFVKLLNKRNHRKIFSFDQKIAFVGSFNISQEHCQEYVGPLAWRDSGVRISGEEVPLFREAFFALWNITIFKNIHSHWIRFNLTLPQRLRSHIQFLKRIRKAQEQIYLVTPYFLPRKSIIRELVKASKRGVDVKILVPESSDVEIMNWIRRYYYPKMLQNQIKVFEYIPRILHAKVALLDQTAIIGSYNLNHRSLLHDQEADVILEDQISLMNLKKQFNLDIENSRKVTDEDIALMSRIEKIRCRFTLFFRYWL